MSSIEGRIIKFMKAVRAGLVANVPAEYQACEACRETACNTERAKLCQMRVRGETQEKSRRSLPLVEITATHA